jgi:hypothetical protein
MSHDGDLGRILVVDDEEPVRDASQHLGELTLLLRIAAELGDLTGPDLAAAESALASARRVPPAAG